ncbi:tail terminator [Gordonia phage Yakult]|nr:tail terminator [Gordonia phage Yakult]
MFGVDPDPPAYPDGLALLVSLLTYRNPGLSVSEDAPRQRPEKYVRIEHLGGVEGPSGAFITPAFALQCYAMNTGDARRTCDDLLRQIKAAQFTHWDGVQIRAWETASLPHPFPDPAVSDRRRWQFAGSLGLSNL